MVRPLRGVSLFTGIGALDLAAVAVGIDVIAQVEINAWCRGKLNHYGKRYWPNAKQFMDVRDFGRASITGPVDVIWGGFPCQDISSAGARAGLRDGARSGLWYEYARIISELRPGVVIVENVAAIASAHKTKDGGIRPADALLVIAHLRAMGYMGSAGIISAADSGGAHVRDRWWCVAYSDSKRLYQPGCKSSLPDQERNYSPQSTGRKRTKYNAVVSSHAVLGNGHGRGLSQGRTGRASARARALRAYSQNTNTIRRRLPQSTMGGAADGLASWFRNPAPVAPQGAVQYAHEPARAISQETRLRVYGTKEHKELVQAIGNAVHIPTAYAVFRAAVEGLAGRG